MAESTQVHINVPVIWVLGGPGSGKGTQCDKIVAKYGFTHLSSGDLLRDEVAKGSARGKEITEIMEKGELVPLDIVLQLIKEAMVAASGTSKGFLIDGYPREKEQGPLFEKHVCPVSVILFFECSEDTLTQRLLKRGEASGRVDDNADTIKLRLRTFNANTAQVLAPYQEKLKTINAERDVNEIFGDVERILDKLVA